MEGIEKIYCVDRNDNCNAALYAAMANNHNNGAELAALMNNNNANNWMNNPFAYIMFLALFRNGVFGGCGDGYGANNGLLSAEIMSRMSNIQDILSDNHNTDLLMQSINGNHDAMHDLASSLNVGFRDVALAAGNIQSSIATLGGQIGCSSEKVINSILLGNKDLTAALQSCCCEQKQLAIQGNYENQIATLNQTNTLTSTMTGISNALQLGFSATAYETLKQTCDILNAGNANTQRIIDTLNSHWRDETALKLQDAKFEISQLKQNQYLVNSLGGNCGCGCGCGCNL